MIYICGKISSYRFSKIKKNVDRFIEAEKALKALGHQVINPATEQPQGKSWDWYMVRSNEFMLKNKPICYFLKNWKKSKGARFEHEMAYYLGLIIIYQ